jgi:hypothetical protein
MIRQAVLAHAGRERVQLLDMAAELPGQNQGH